MRKQGRNVKYDSMEKKNKKMNNKSSQTQSEKTLKKERNKVSSEETKTKQKEESQGTTVYINSSKGKNTRTKANEISSWSPVKPACVIFLMLVCRSTSMTILCDQLHRH